MRLTIKKGTLSLGANELAKLTYALATNDKTILKEFKDIYDISPEDFIGRDDVFDETDNTPNAIIFDSYENYTDEKYKGDKTIVYRLSPSNLVDLINHNLDGGVYCDLCKTHFTVENGLDFYIHDDFYDEYGNAIQPSTLEKFISPLDKSFTNEQKFRRSLWNKLIRVIQQAPKRYFEKKDGNVNFACVKYFEVKFQEVIENHYKEYYKGKVKSIWWEVLERDAKTHQPKYDIFSKVWETYGFAKNSKEYKWYLLHRNIPEIALRQAKFYKRSNNIKQKEVEK